MAKKWHLYIWEPGVNDSGGEMKHFDFPDKSSLIEYMNQMAREMETLPRVSGEFGLTAMAKMTISDYVYNGYVYINYGEDMDIKLTEKQDRIADVFIAE